VEPDPLTAQPTTEFGSTNGPVVLLGRVHRRDSDCLRRACRRGRLMNSTRIRGPIGITAHPEADGIVDGQIAPCQPPERVGRDASLPTPRRFEPRSRVHRVAPRGATPPKRTGWTTWPWRSDPQPDPGDPMTDLRRPAAVWRMEGGPADEPAPSHPTAPTGSGGQDASRARCRRTPAGRRVRRRSRSTRAHPCTPHDRCRRHEPFGFATEIGTNSSPGRCESKTGRIGEPDSGASRASCRSRSWFGRRRFGRRLFGRPRFGGRRFKTRRFTARRADTTSSDRVPPARVVAGRDESCGPSRVTIASRTPNDLQRDPQRNPPRSLQGEGPCQRP